MYAKKRISSKKYKNIGTYCGLSNSLQYKYTKRLVFPVMRKDSVTQIIKYDELLIAFGNKMCQKYRLQHQHDMIRARLRLLGRFFIVLRDLDNSIVDFSSIYDPTNYEQCIKAVNKFAQFDEKTWTHKIPSIASSLGTLIK